MIRCEMCGDERNDEEKKICFTCEKKLEGLDDIEGWIKDYRKKNIEEYDKRIDFLEKLKEQNQN